MLVEVFDRGNHPIKMVSVSYVKDGLIVLKHVGNNPLYDKSHYARLTDQDGTTLFLLHIYHHRGETPDWRITDSDGVYLNQADYPNIELKTP